MERKRTKKVFLLAQLLIVSCVSAIVAIGCGSTSNLFSAGAQGAYCGGSGYTFIGYYDTNSACSSACGAKGYSSYCTGENTTACYCK